jgi:hypothetical protein
MCITKVLACVLFAFPFVLFSQKMNAKLLQKTTWTVGKYVKGAEEIFAEDTLQLESRISLSACAVSKSLVFSFHKKSRFELCYEPVSDTLQSGLITIGWKVEQGKWRIDKRSGNLILNHYVFCHACESDDIDTWDLKGTYCYKVLFSSDNLLVLQKTN